MEGWIKIHSKIVNWEWSNDSNMVSLLLHLLIRANYKPSKWRGIDIKRGQLLTGRKQLSKWTGISEQTIRTCIERLKSTSEITIQSTNKYSVISICNYDKYQQTSTSKSTSKLTNDQPATNHIQEEEERKEDNIRELENSFSMIAETGKVLGTNEKKVKELLGKFIQEQKASDTLGRDLPDLRKHFVQWSKKHFKGSSDEITMVT